MNREQISQFLTVMRFSLKLLGHRRCVACYTWTGNKSLSGTAGATGSVKALMRTFCGFEGSWCWSCLGGGQASAVVVERVAG